MMTATQYAKYLVKREREALGIPDKISDEDLTSYVFQSSTLGVALEFLGLIKDPTIKEHISSRGGVMAIYSDYETKDIATLSVREMLSILQKSSEIS